MAAIGNAVVFSPNRPVLIVTKGQLKINIAAATAKDVRAAGAREDTTVDMKPATIAIVR